MTSSYRNSSCCDSSYYSISIAKTNIHISLITKPITVKKKKTGMLLMKACDNRKTLKCLAKENDNIPVYYTKREQYVTKGETLQIKSVYYRNKD